jgi:hypothetical protein
VARTWPKCDARDFPGKGAVVEVQTAEGWQRREVRRRGWDALGAFFRVVGEDAAAKQQYRPDLFGVLWRWVEEKAEAVSHQAGAGDSVDAAAGVSAGFPDTVGEAVEVSNFVEGKRDGWQKTKVSSVGGDDDGKAVFFTAEATGPVPYYKSSEGVHWRWPEAPQGLQDATALDDVRPEAEAVDPELEKELAAALVFDAGLAALRTTHGKSGIPELPALAAPRTCKGIPIFQGPAEACDAILGPEVQGDRCVACAEWMRVRGECDGCNVRVPGWTVTGKLCAECKDTLRTNKARGERVAEAMLSRFEEGATAEQPNDGRKLAAEIIDDCYEDFYGALWETMLCDAELDRRTAEVCKRLRDDERLVRGRRP